LIFIFAQTFLEVASPFVVGTTRFAEPASSLRNDLLKDEAVKTFSHSLGQDPTFDSYSITPSAAMSRTGRHGQAHVLAALTEHNWFFGLVCLGDA
jgi:hypothetical protein